MTTTLENANTAAERQILKDYLARYFRAKKKQAMLQHRLHRLRQELHPEAEGGDALSPLEIEARIEAQAEAAKRSISEVMDILDFLPPNSIERIILELRHLDCKPWRDIRKTVYLTASPCFEHYNKGLDALLAMAEVRRTLGLPTDDTGGCGRDQGRRS